MYQFDPDFYKQCHAERFAELRIAYQKCPPTQDSLAAQVVPRHVRRWSRLRYASTRHAPAFRS